MNGTYIPQDIIDDARNAYGFGVPLDKIAGHIGVSVAELQNALGLPQWKSEPVQDRQRELPFDLFATDRLDSVL